MVNGQTHYRAHWIEHLQTAPLRESTRIVGWIGRIRDHGGLIFMDLWDHTGKIQLVFEPSRADLFKKAAEFKKAFVIGVTGELKSRPSATEQEDVLGTLEVEVHEVEVYNSSVPLPFDMGEAGISEELRLKYRFLDLRDPVMQYRLRLRAVSISMMRSYLEMQGFLDVETPILTKATPEGARDYLVPSRTHKGHCFALPQSPQIFKQLLMCSGLDRYYQFARCFRDEDLRADRQPEFTQLDLEMAFVDECDVMNLAEGMVTHLFKAVLDVDLPEFPVISYKEAMDSYGCDRPDLTFDMPCLNLNEVLKNNTMSMIQSVLADGGDWMGLCLKSQSMTRRVADELTTWMISQGAGGLVWIKVTEEGISSPIAKFLDEATVKHLMSALGAEIGDVIFFAGGDPSDVRIWMGQLRLHLAEVFKIEKSEWAPLWVIDFPMFEKKDDQSLQSMHHPFTAAQDWSSAPEDMIAKAYDFVLNGYEMGGGSVRIHQYDQQLKVFEHLGLSKEKSHEQFDHLLQALSMGAPPHAGLALGMDRLLMMMSKVSSIRDVIAFPKTQSAHCPLTGAPGVSDLKALHELGMKLNVSRGSE